MPGESDITLEIVEETPIVIELMQTGPAGATGGVTSVNGRDGVVVLDKTDVGLTNVDNTSDANKPISTATQTALDAKKTDSMATNKLLGRGTAGTGAIEEITIGSNLSLTGTTLNATGGGGGGGTVDTIVAGSNIDVDATDPANPIVAVETLNSGDVGLGNVDNTSDATKNAATANLTNKTLDNTNTITVKDTLLTIQDDGDATKQAKFQASSISAGQTRTYTFPDRSDTLVLLGGSQSLASKTLVSPVLSTGVSGTAVDTDGTLAANSDTLLASQKAVKTYSDTKVTGPASVTDDNPAVFDGTTGKLIKQKTYAAFKTLLALVKGDVGLGNVDNTSDANKPVSTAQQTALDLKQSLSAKDQANGYAGLDSSTKINPSQLPAIAITETFVVASQAAMLALTAQVGDVAVRTDQNKSYILTADPASTLGNWQELLTPTDAVSSVFSRSGVVTAQNGDYTASQVTNAPAGSIAGTTVQAAIDELDSEKQPLDSDLTTIAGLTATTDNFMVATASAWSSRTPSQARTQLGLGSIATLSTIDLTTNVTGILPSANGGTANGFTKFSGPTTSEKTFTLPDASSTIVVQGGALGTPSSGTLTNAAGLPVAGITSSTSTALGVGSLELGHASANTLTAASGVLSIEGIVIPSISSTNTLTNKRITQRVTALTSSATPTINTDDCDWVDITALAAAITSMTSNLSGTPTNKQKLSFEIKDNGTARAITWGSSFVAGGVALPTTTVISKILTVGFIYSTANSLNKWRCVASTQET